MPPRLSILRQLRGHIYTPEHQEHQPPALNDVVPVLLQRSGESALL
jgi:hypothetical protein